MKQKVKTSNKKYILSKKRLDYLRLVYRPGQISSYVLSLPRPTGQEKPGLQNQRVHQIEKQLKTLFSVLYYLHRICGFHFQSISVESFCNEAFVVSGSYASVFRMYKIRCLSNRFYKSDVHLSKGAE